MSIMLFLAVVQLVCLMFCVVCMLCVISNVVFNILFKKRILSSFQFSKQYKLLN
jgi:hypothetical protein